MSESNSEINRLKNELNNLFKNYNKLLLDINKFKKEIIDKKNELKKICNHTEINKTRHYSSGMHRPQYYYECNICDSNLSFSEYCEIYDQITKLNEIDI